MKKIKLLILTIALNLMFAQGTAGVSSRYEFRSLIDMPTAGILDRGNASVLINFLPSGVMVTKMEVGVFKNFSFGISYGAANVIGTGNPEWYKLPGINARLRLFNETLSNPAITIGFDSQGKGLYDDVLERFEIKSPGFFVAISKNYNFMGFISLHAGINYSLEREDGDKDANMWIGVEKSLGDVVSLVMEYDFAINDNSARSWGDGNGYLNAAVKWSVGKGFTIGVEFRNLVDNKKRANFYAADRAIRVEYITPIFTRN